MTAQRTIDLEELLDLLGYTPDEHLQLCYQKPGEPFASIVALRSDMHDRAGPPSQTANWWFSVNPTTGPARANAGRGGAADVTRLAGLWVDLDVKPGGCPDLETAMLVVQDLSEALGMRPAAVTFSGHGVQPIWPIEDGGIDGSPMSMTVPLSRLQAAALLRRWGRLVANIADRRQCGVDSLYDLPRVLRAPGSVNWKHPDKPIQVATYADTGAPVTVDKIREVLAEYGIPELPHDGTDPGVVLSAPAEWTAAAHSCAYSRNAIAGWAKDTPTARHPWLVAQATRLAAMHRNNCLTDADHQAAEHTLIDRFRALVSGAGDRGATPGEIRGALNWGIETVATFTAEHLAGELGNHEHTNAPIDAPPVTSHRLQAVPSIPLNRGAGGAPPTGPPQGLHESGSPGATPHAVIVGATVTHIAEAPSAAAKPQSLKWSEDGLALQLIEQYGHMIRYQPERKKWLSWSGSRWHWQAEGAAVWQMVRGLAREIPDVKALEAFKRRALTAGGVAGVLRHAAADERVHVQVAELDSDPMTINTPSGLVDLRTGAIRPATPADLVTRSTAVAPILEQPEPVIWRDFLTVTFGGDPELIRYVQQLAGLALVGDTREQIMPFWYGEGRNGKSTLIEALRYVMGSGAIGYAKSAPAEMLMARKFEAHSTELADIAGARLVLCSELEDGQQLAEARVKNLTSSEPITARFLYGQPFSFPPTFLVLLVGNHRPQTTAGGFALWRRIRAVPFNHRMPDNQIDRNLPEKLQVIGGHILGWAIRGAVDYLANGMVRSAAVTGATADYEADQNNVTRFIKEMCTVTGGQGAVQYQQMHTHYEKWCRESGEEPMSSRRLVPAILGIPGITKGRSDGQRYYNGVILSTPHRPPPNPPTTTAELFGLKS